MDIKELVREDLRSLVPYEPYVFPDVVKLDANENPYPFPPEVIQDIFNSLKGDTFTRYPDPFGRELTVKLAGLTGVDPENIVLGNGSDELIQLILQTFGGPGKRVVIPYPTFSMYKVHGQITGTRPVEVPRDGAFGLVMDEMLPEVENEGTRVVYIATPNNPTGNCVPVDQIRQLLKAAASGGGTGRLGKGALVVVDEAYIDFGGETCLPLLGDYPNLVILRTFSKVALAGLRIGYLLAAGEVVRELLKVKQPYNVNAFSQTAALAVLDRWPVFREQIKKIVSERDRLAAELGKIQGVTVFPSMANFILFGVPGEPGEIHRQLLNQGVLIRYGLGRSHGLDRCMRVTIGIRQENDLFLEKIKGILST